jgi:hypothetical protein
MSIWVAVVFFCAGSECAFWKADELFTNKKECEVSLHKAMDSLERNGAETAGACMSIKMTQT